jgi:hypothetical protein
MANRAALPCDPAQLVVTDSGGHSVSSLTSAPYNPDLLVAGFSNGRVAMYDIRAPRYVRDVTLT